MGQKPITEIRELYGADYVWISREERKNFMDPEGVTEADILLGQTPVFESGDVKIYEVVDK